MRADTGNGDPLDAAERLGFPDTLTRHGWTGHEHADRAGVVQKGDRLTGDAVPVVALTTEL
jgi:hypothetical protein